MKDETKLVVAGRDPESNHGIVNPPVYHASTVLHPTLAALDDSRKRREQGERGVFYGRRGTPTTFSLEDMVCAVEAVPGLSLRPGGGRGLAAIVPESRRPCAHVGRGLRPGPALQQWLGGAP